MDTDPQKYRIDLTGPASFSLALAYQLLHPDHIIPTVKLISALAIYQLVVDIYKFPKLFAPVF